MDQLPFLLSSIVHLIQVWCCPSAHRWGHDRESLLLVSEIKLPRASKVTRVTLTMRVTQLLVGWVHHCWYYNVCLFYFDIEDSLSSPFYVKLWLTSNWYLFSILVCLCQQTHCIKTIAHLSLLTSCISGVFPSQKSDQIVLSSFGRLDIRR